MKHEKKKLMRIFHCSCKMSGTDRNLQMIESNKQMEVNPFLQSLCAIRNCQGI